MKNKIHQISPMANGMEFDSTYANTEETDSGNPETDSGTETGNAAAVLSVPLVKEDGTSNGCATLQTAEGETEFCVPTTAKVNEMLWKDGVLFEHEGSVCTYGSVESIGGTNAAGDSWQQIEKGAPMDEPYLNEWGWQCCLRESTAENHNQPMELYRWLYRCMKEGLSVPERTIRIGDESFSFVTNGGKADSEELEEIKNDVESNGVKANIFNKILADAYTTFLRIPVMQFGITNENILDTLCQRVMNDNPLLIFPLYNSVLGAVPAIKDENEVYQYIYSAFPTEEKLCQAQEVCNERIREIVEEVEKECHIRPGDSLPGEIKEKAKILKVIHDCIIKIGNLETSQMRPWLLATAYAVFDDRYKGNCMSYTNAFCLVARMYGFEALHMDGDAYYDANNNKTQEEPESYGHSWVAVWLGDGTYGTYASDESQWSCIDVYWDEPANGICSPAEEISWDYFLDPERFNFLKDEPEEYMYTYRLFKPADTSYGALPFGEIPGCRIKYENNTFYIWEEEQWKNL